MVFSIPYSWLKTRPKMMAIKTPAMRTGLKKATRTAAALCAVSAYAQQSRPDAGTLLEPQRQLPTLPAPGGYTVWARALGKPYGEGTLTTCATDVTGAPAEGDICSELSEVFVRGTGTSSFRNVTSNLTTISLDPVLDAAAVDACGGTTVSLFDGCLEGYFWQYDNHGLKLLQLRFYPAAL